MERERELSCSAKRATQARTTRTPEKSATATVNQSGEIDMRFGKRGTVAGLSQDRVETPNGQDDSGHRAEQSQDGAFREDLSVNRQPSAPSAHGQLFFSPARIRASLQVRDVRAGNEQHASDRAQKQVKALPIFPTADSNSNCVVMRRPVFDSIFFSARPRLSPNLPALVGGQRPGLQTAQRQNRDDCHAAAFFNPKIIKRDVDLSKRGTRTDGGRTPISRAKLHRPGDVFQEHRSRRRNAGARCHR
jgi:hypothetical protein